MSTNFNGTLGSNFMRIYTAALESLHTTDRWTGGQVDGCRKPDAHIYERKKLKHKNVTKFAGKKYKTLDVKSLMNRNTFCRGLVCKNRNIVLTTVRIELRITIVGGNNISNISWSLHLITSAVDAITCNNIRPSKY
jgi:hypothetical protein